MLKSAVLFSKKPLHFYIFAEDELHKSFRNTVSICGFICYVSQPISTHSPTVPLEFFFIHAVQLHNNGHLRPLYSTEKSLIVFEKTLGNQQVKNKQTKRISVTKCILKGILAALACRNIPEDEFRVTLASYNNTRLNRSMAFWQLSYNAIKKPEVGLVFRWKYQVSMAGNFCHFLFLFSRYLL